MAPKKGAKRAKAATALDPDVAVRMHEALQAGQLDGADLATALRADAPGCEPSDKPVNSCKGRKDNPNCLCGLVPAHGSFRRKGLWQKDPEAVAKLGIDPADSRREQGTPVGLNNLGNTCYVNAALQCLFANHAFRGGVFDLEHAGNAGDPIIRETRRLFAELQAGPRLSADPTAFAATLALDHSVQQDGGEFMKLLLNLLERLFRESGVQAVQELVPDLFRGQYAYETTCQVCGQLSASSKRLTDFYELDINIRGFPTLVDSLTSYLEPELLTGDNRYLCEACGRKVDATRQMRLRTLPPYLAFSLQRFVFKPETGAKVKASDKFGFPLSLDLGAFVSPAEADAGSQGTAEAAAGGAGAAADVHAEADATAAYELVAILIHKGSSASHGHYVAHVRGECGGGWWRYDDSEVTRMERGPAGEHGDHGTVADKKAKAAKAAKDTIGELAAADAAGPEVIDLEAPETAAAAPLAPPVANGHAGGTASRKAAGGKAAGGSLPPRKAAPGRAAAGKQQGPKRKGGPTAAATGSAAAAVPGNLANGHGAATDAINGAAPMDVAGTGAEAAATGAAAADSITSANAYLLVYRRRSDAPALPAPELPASLQQDMAAEQQKFDEECASHQGAGSQWCYDVQGAKQAALAAVNERRDAVRRILNAAAIEPGAAADARWVDAGWLAAWADGAEPPPPIDNAPLLCSHGKLDPYKAAEGKRVSSAAWRALQGAHRGGPELSLADACTVCLEVKLRGIAAAQDASQVRGEVMAQLEAAEAASREDGTPQPSSFYVSASWLAGFKRRAGKSVGAAAPTEGIACPHGGLLPESRGGRARRAAVPPAVWAHFSAGWQAERQTAAEAAAAAAKAESEKAADDVIDLDSPRHRQPLDPQGPRPAAAQAEAALPPPLPAFRVGSAAECVLCASGLASDLEQHQGVRSQAATERQALGNLAAGTVLALEPDTDYFLLPRWWLAAWRAWLQAAAKKGAAAAAQQPAPPPPLADALAAAFCSCHSGEGAMLAQWPPRVALKRGKWQVVPGEGDDFFEVATAGDWTALQGFHSDGGSSLRSVAARLIVDKEPSPSRGGSPAAAAAEGNGLAPMDISRDAPAAAGPRASREPSSRERSPRERSPALPGARADECVIGDDLKYLRPRGGAARGGGDSATLATRPPVCEESLAAAAADTKRARLTYSAAEIMVALATEAEATAPEAAAAPAAGERRSKRARRGRAPLAVSSGDTLGKLKLRVFEALEIHPRNAALHLRGRLLDDDEATLAECEIYPGDEVHLVDRGIFDNDDVGSLFGGGGPSAKRERERGFTGTALTGGPGAKPAPDAGAAGGSASGSDGAPAKAAPMSAEDAAAVAMALDSQQDGSGGGPGADMSSEDAAAVAAALASE